jgi:TolA-binding protein
VLVRGDDVPDRVRRLTAGESLRVTHAAPATPGSAVAAPEPVEASSTMVAPTTLPQETSSAATVPTLAPSAVAPSFDAVSAIYDEADRARRSGQPSEAARLLESAVLREPSGQRAALACFTLGRLYLESLGQPAAAARSFERSLSAGTPRGLEEDARARLVEARARMSDAEGARRAAAEYRARFPHGRRAEEVNRWSPGE